MGAPGLSDWALVKVPLLRARTSGLVRTRGSINSWVNESTFEGSFAARETSPAILLSAILAPRWGAEK